MIELNNKTQQDFLNREWMQRLLDAGVNVSDAKYYITKDKWDKDNKKVRDYITIKEDLINAYCYDICPTYTVSELLYKLHEYIYPEIEGNKYSGGLKFCKDAPFYIFYYDLKKIEPYTDEEFKEKEDYIYAEFEYPIESLASILIQCHKKDIGIATKDTGNISNK